MNIEFINGLVKKSNLNDLTGAKKSISDRLIELSGGFYQNRKKMKEERLLLKTCLKKINKRITLLTTPKE